MKTFLYFSLLVALLVMSETALGKSFRQWREEKRGCKCGSFNGCPCPMSGKRNFPYETRLRDRRREESRLIPDGERNYLKRMIAQQDTDGSYSYY